MKIPLMPSLSKRVEFCSPRMLRGVTIIWMPCGRKRSGIQNVNVLPIPVPAIEIMSQSPHRTCLQTCTCHAQGVLLKHSKVFEQISLNDGIYGSAAISVQKERVNF